MGVDNSISVTEDIIVPKSPDIQPVSSSEAQPFSVLSDMAIDHFTQGLSDIEGAALVPEVAKANLDSLTQALDTAQKQIQKNGVATLFLFGKYKTFHDLDEVETIRAKIASDMGSISGLPVESVLEKGLPIIDKYLFDTKSPERIGAKKTRMLVIVENYESEIVRDLRERGIVPKTERKTTFSDRLQAEGLISLESRPVEYREDDPNPFESGNIASASLDYLNRMKGDSFLHTGQVLPEVVIVELSGSYAFQKNHEGLQQLFRDYWGNLKREERPVVILFTPDFEPPLYEKSSYGGFLFASNLDQLRITLPLAEDIADVRRSGSIEERAVLASRQEKQYDDSFDLRDWEHITADTYQSLAHILKAFTRREEAEGEIDDVEEKVPTTEEEAYALMRKHQKKELEQYMHKAKGKVRTVLDLGAGEGRIAIALARLGFNVVGLDISQEQLQRGEQRLREEGEGLRGERQNPKLSYNALRKLEDEGRLSQRPILDDEATRQHYVTLKGDFDTMLYDVNQLLVDWDQLHPDIDKYTFFNADPWNEYAFEDPRDMFAEVTFDVAMFNWHTFCEISSSDKQQDALRSAMRMLNPGGLFILEIPDRTVDPYASLIKEYHDSHPNSRYGTRQDTFEKDDKTSEEFTPRYFPGRNEIVTQLQAAGFEIDPSEDVETYLITSDNQESGKKQLNAKELFIVAHKPWS